MRLHETRPPAMIRTACTLAPLLAWLIVAAPLAAQEVAGTAGRSVLTGRVLDGASGTPLHGALVTVVQTRQQALTDEDGRFSLRMRAGEYTLAFSQLGYEDGEARVQIDEGAVTGDFVMTPRPIVLEGIQVLEDRFRYRRNGVAMPVRVLDRQALLASSGTALDAIATRAHVSLVPCRGLSSSRMCGRIRGREQPITVAIDERPAFGGLDELATYMPHEVFLIEVYGGGRHIRAYTVWYMERAAQRPLHPVPVF